ncbi:MAG: DNA-3-methyladenine glycosylase 2 family protein [Proteobacteria bacterium]|nr:DNA-3-methyladenine glycosylase 2 family protein [Pseudomonadota bacterium]
MTRHITRHLCAADPVMAALISTVGPYRNELDEDLHPFQALAQAIAHQQLNGTAARTILGRLILNCGSGAFPTPQEIIRAPLAALCAAGFSGSKAAALKDLAEKTLANVVPDGATLAALSDDEIVERLTQVRGIGRWTVEMLLMFRLGRPDVLPVDDFGVRAGFQAAYGLASLPHPKALLAFGERWRPHRSAAAWYLWRALDLKREKKLPPPPQKMRLPRIARRRRKKVVAQKRAKAARKTSTGKAGAARARAAPRARK